MGEIDRTSHSYLLGVCQYELGTTRDALRSVARELENLFAMVEGEAPSLLEDHFSYPDIVASIEMAKNLLNNIKFEDGK